MLWSKNRFFFNDPVPVVKLRTNDKKVEQVVKLICQMTFFFPIDNIWALGYQSNYVQALR